ncbi:putative alpha-1,2-mannosidase [Amycolatopsis bartoniae]|uniref:Alpha-1 2-mannosidase n=1 Tax=Amycolatopsis bartoniae TaxID=941986 RepID=A0A8H9IU61_9PSEU|nr:GH92 family glycosyl hydrolase [Amycolatopsis bartoniae]MBB2934359.1 putative alpha-1,2-mannosidase [Amycolatopsis bartoniae]TVS99939.1 glycoside hydrolase family 92 protein [Amycolatopsis bartoniae]GHF47918.1 alpha-1 2-mannosidase [Amycolatopsis bartoniae]
MKKLVAVLAAALVPAAVVTPVAAAAPVDVLDSVNTFIGTQDEGNTFPGASAPFGMTQVSPIGSHYAGYQYTDTAIRGFGHFFLSGAGCWEQGGLVSTLPRTGTFDPANPSTFDQTKYASPYTHDGEVGSPGYYKVHLTGYGGIDVETTATTRTGVERYTFDQSGPAQVFVNTGQANDKEPVSGSSIRIVDNRTVEGTVESQAFCGGKPYTTYFRTTFDKPFTSYGTWSPTGGTPGSKESAGGAGLRGAWLSFDNPGSVTASTAISYVDADGARRNLAAEGNRSFDKVKAATVNTWRKELSTIDVSGGTNDNRTVFYTSLYHTLLQPLTGNDVDGRYRGFDNQIHRAVGWTYYQYFSLWDTYRSQNQLIALLRPDRARDIAQSILAIHDQGGWLPRWAYANQETNTMTGDPVTPYLVDLWRFGALRGLEGKAYQALLQNSTQIPPADSPFQGRSGNESYQANGFVQYDPNFPKKGQDTDPNHGASATLEYALADCSLSIMARGLGKTQDANALAAKGQNYRVLWDSTVSDRGFTGFPRPKVEGGAWFTPADGPYTPEGQDGFHEGTAWQYQWLTQQDIPGLVQRMGGQQATTARLDDFFAYSDLLADPAKTVREEWVTGPYNYYNQFRYNPNNEPDLHSPWMYTLVGQPWKTSAVVRAAHTLFTNAPNGVTGNDDLGEMSAWYVFSSLGLYPAVPGTGQFVLSAPQFAKTVVHLENGRDIVLKAGGADASQLQYVQGLRVNGVQSDRAYVSLEQLTRGSTLDFRLTADAAKATWATGPGGAPPSPCA